MQSAQSKVFLLVALFFSLFATSCKMVNEDLPDCPQTMVVIDFEYKYHMSSEYLSTEDDWLQDQAGSIYLYVFDEDGYFLFRESKHKTFLNQNKPDFSIWLDEGQCEPGKTYKFAAMAQGNHAGYESSLATPGFVLQEEMKPHVSTISSYQVKLDRNDDGIYDLGVTDNTGFFNWKDSYKDNNLKLDTLWSTRPGFIRTITVPERNFSYNNHVGGLDNLIIRDTIPMMRITNSIKINLVYQLFDKDTNVDDYKFLIDFPKGNGTVGLTGDLSHTQELQYYTLRKKVVQYQEKNQNAKYDSESDNDKVSDELPNSSNNTKSYDNLGTRAASYCVNAEFGVSRLQTSDGSFLQIINANTGNEIARIDNLSDWLANYFSHRYDDQEFLDREYDYTIDVMIDSDGRGYTLQAGCNILGWGRRIHYYNL